MRVGQKRLFWHLQKVGGDLSSMAKSSGSLLSFDIAFSHAFQPIVDIEARQVTSYEVLVRGVNNEPAGDVFKNVSTEELYFLDQYSRERALRLAASLGVDCRLNLNFSPGAIVYDNCAFLRETRACAKSVGLSPKQIVPEITEEEAFREHEHLVEAINEFRKNGVVFAIDDFGAGYAGLNMLAEIQPEFLKLDMALVRNINENGPRQSIVRAISDVCLDLGIDTIAEGVETVGELEFLRKCGINLFQGYLLSKPCFEGLSTISFDLLET